MLSPYTFTTIDRGAQNTYAYGINNEGDIVGSYGGSYQRDGFLKDGGGYQTIHYPGSDWTYPFDINDAGQIAGWQLALTADFDTWDFGFLNDSSGYHMIDYSSINTSANGINDAGQIVGQWVEEIDEDPSDAVMPVE